MEWNRDLDLDTMLINSDGWVLTEYLDAQSIHFKETPAHSTLDCHDAPIQYVSDLKHAEGGMAVQIRMRTYNLLWIRS